MPLHGSGVTKKGKKKEGKQYEKKGERKGKHCFYSKVF